MSLKTFSLLIATSITLGLTSRAQKAVADSTETIIQKIREEFRKINADSSRYRVVKKDIWDESTEGGEMVKFYEGKELKKAEQLFYGETGKAAIEYYFMDGQLIFYFKRETHYDKPFTVEGWKVKEVLETRCYFNNGTLVRWIDPKARIVNKARYAEKQREVLEELKTLKA